jgi:hypothetical protein
MNNQGRTKLARLMLQPRIVAARRKDGFSQDKIRQIKVKQATTAPDYDHQCAE